MLVLLVRYATWPDDWSNREHPYWHEEDHKGAGVCDNFYRLPQTNKLAGAKRKSLGDLCVDVDLAMLAANRGNAMVVLNAIYYSHEIGVCLENLAYGRLAKDPTKMIVLKSLLADDSCRLHPDRSRHPRHYRPLKVHKDRVTVMPAGSNVGGSTFWLSKHLPDMPSPFVGHLPQHMKNSTEIIHTA